VRLDYLTIFPDYLAPLSLSLPGKAIEKGLVQIHVHDLRGFTTDRHRKVDDTPYGGGAGMVMKPEPFGAAFEQIVTPATTIVFTTPSGQPMTQQLAHELAAKEHLVFACGRYEGIDQRVLDHAATIAEVREISLGDYVLNGGEVAALAITEAVIRLIPGFIGNAESLVEESHALSDSGAGLLEYPVYTKPQHWQGREVPEVLLSGDHGKVRQWRHQQQLERTAARRPDLLHASQAATDWPITRATRADAAEIMVLQRACWVQEALANDDLHIPLLTESRDDIEQSIREWDTWVVRSAGRLVGSVRGRLRGTTWEIGRFMVAADLQGRGLGRALLDHIQSVAPAAASDFFLFTGARSERNQRLYRKAGFRLRPDLETPPNTVALTKQRRDGT
jgi:tRNA (guanine37-N1)-methyltransferase